MISVAPPKTKTGTSATTPDPARSRTDRRRAGPPARRFCVRAPAARRTQPSTPAPAARAGLHPPPLSSALQPGPMQPSGAACLRPTPRPAPSAPLALSAPPHARRASIPSTRTRARPVLPRPRPPSGAACPLPTAGCARHLHTLSSPAPSGPPARHPGCAFGPSRRALRPAAPRRACSFILPLNSGGELARHAPRGGSAPSCPPHRPRKRKGRPEGRP